MQRHVGFHITFSSDFHPPLKWYLHAETLLGLVRDASNTALTSGTAPGTAGTRDDPWVLDTFDAWKGAAKRLIDDEGLKSQDIYMRAGGRLIHKSAQGRGTGDGYYISDDALSGTDTDDGNIWSRGAGASYREFGRMFQDRSGGAYAEAVWSKETAAKLRGVLLGTSDFSTSAPESLESPLPMLACAMFIAEVARNKREFVIGLMMLDLIGESYGRAGTKIYSLEKVFSHPDRLPKTDVAISKPQAGPSGKRVQYLGPRGAKVRTVVPQTVGPLARPGDLFMVEGKYPASPGGSASTQETISIAEDYVQQKEASIAANWLRRKMSNFLGVDDTVVQCVVLRHDQDLSAYERVGGGNVVRAPKPEAISHGFMQTCAKEFEDVAKTMITARAGSFG
ncbi:MAG: hypothetical protein AAGD13_02565 [Pseudomonadota bacterium]